MDRGFLAEASGKAQPPSDRRRARKHCPYAQEGAHVELVHSGKVRDVYADGDDLLLVASDRVSIYDVILPTPVPGKGRILTQLSLWWFDRLGDITPNHVISATDVPAEWAGRAIRCQRLEMVPVECIARGYLAGLGLTAYNETGAVSGVPLPPGLVEASKLPEPVFTPTTKAAAGHDEPMTFDEVVDLVGAETATELRRITLEVYQRGAGLAGERGIIVADTKLEFGRTKDGTLVLADEVLTPDSSRFWPTDSYSPGRPQHSFDKQYLRDWSTSIDWNRAAPGPEIPADVLRVLAARYAELYEMITGQSAAA
jgi:phosphoribosylaminoimidazole-succinocarboxamide synthase